eukprot:scaffold1134_cov143-Isochrysis_galbana.AAC.1
MEKTADATYSGELWGTPTEGGFGALRAGALASLRGRPILGARAHADGRRGVGGLDDVVDFLEV